MMIGQQFSPFSQQDDPRMQQQQPGGGDNIQQAIQILRIRYPHVFGGYSPSPLAGPGSAMMPPRPSTPMPLPMPGGMQSPMGGPSMPGPSFGGGTFGGGSPWARPGGEGGGGGGSEPTKPVINYIPPPPIPGGTAGPNPPGLFPPTEFPRPRPQAPTRVPR